MPPGSAVFQRNLRRMSDLAIIGGGLVGSLLSVYLGERGHRVHVYDKRPDFRNTGASGGRSINLALSDRGLRALSTVGLDDEVRQLCIPMHGRMMHDVHGKLTFQAYGKEGQFINSISRGGLNLLLMEYANRHPDVHFHFEQACEGYDLETHRVQMRNAVNGEIHELAPERVFATDGAFSAMRTSLQKRPRFDYQQDYLAHGYKELTIPAAEDGGWRIDKNALHIWPRESFMLIALPNLDGSFTVTLFAPFDGPEGFDALDNEKAVKAYFEKHFPDTLDLMPDLMADFFGNPTAALVTIRCYPWAYGKSLMMGDASHAIVPFYGQGMNSGFEDVRVLGDLMNQFGDNWNRIFPAFEQERKANADAIAELAKRNFVEMRDHVADPLFLLRKKIAAAVAQRHPDRFIPVYSMVSFSHIPYAEALEEMDRQDRLFGEILSWPDIETRWESAYAERIDAVLLS